MFRVSLLAKWLRKVTSFATPGRCDHHADECFDYRPCFFERNRQQHADGDLDPIEPCTEKVAECAVL